MGKPAGPNKRSPKKFFIATGRQLKLTLAMLSIGILTTAILLGYMVLQVSATISTLQGPLPEAANLVRETIGPALDIMIVGQGLLWLFCLLVGVLVSHRIYGPLVPLLRHIRNLQDGTYSSRVKLREGDELEDVALALNALAEKLEGAKDPPQ